MNHEMRSQSFICSLFAMIIVLSSCSGQTETISTESQNHLTPNTKFVIHYKKAADMAEGAFYTKLTEYQVFALEDYSLVNIPGATMKDNALTRTWHFYMASPRILNMGFTTIYVEAGDSLDLTYEQLGMDQYKARIEKIKINTLNSFILWNKPETPEFAGPSYRVEESKMATQTNIARYFRLNYIDSLSIIYTGNIFAKNPQFKKTRQREEFIRLALLQINFNNLVSSFNSKFSDFKADMQLSGTAKLLEMYKAISKKFPYNMRTFPYYHATGILYTLAFQSSWEKEAFRFIKIDAGLGGYDTLTRQYLLLQTLKKNMTDVKTDKANLGKIYAAITDTILRRYADKYIANKVDGKTEQGYLTNEIQNIPIYGTDLKPIPFGDIFKNTQQPSLYLDFCGSWCPPCLKEIIEYAKSERKFDNSTKARPIWLFFENNTAAWLKVIEKYQLKKENCFLVMDKKLQDLFGPQFGWAGEFPHHFLFSRDGRMINENAPSLLKLNENSFLGKSSTNVPSPPK